MSQDEKHDSFDDFIDNDEEKKDQEDKIEKEGENNEDDENPLQINIIKKTLDPDGDGDVDVHVEDDTQPIESPPPAENQNITNNEEEEKNEDIHVEDDQDEVQLKEEESQTNPKESPKEKPTVTISKQPLDPLPLDSNESSANENGEQNENKISEDDIQAAVDLIIDGANPEDFDQEVLNEVVKRLTSLRIDAKNNKRYQDAENYRQLIANCNKAADIAGFSKQCVNTFQDYANKEADALTALEELDQKWNEEFRQFEEVIEEKKNQLKQQHTKELEDFDNNLPETLPGKYHKHSVEYILLRKKEASLARNQQYKEAQKVKRTADRLEKLEDAAQLEKLQEDLQFQRENIILKHNRQIELFAQWVTERRNQMLIHRDKDMQGRVKRLEHYRMLVTNLEKKGLPPNPTYGYTTNRVSRKESIMAVRTAASTPIDRSTMKSKREDLPLQYRPQSSLSLSRGSSKLSTRKSPVITPKRNNH
ncbi:hypothetical protein TVAG_195520 [Trichomonas vaginalis G3]|uniref:Uncharacterized protein n=1 Tax=Trichomonas vaginalis (strain ATCC PRA-98 / G3) TaxID=412133 RepID=A2FM01_TRIV3|nr:(methyl)glyoxal oxidase [Trichomonas vaginalis G3]EAX94090.1 hypothetical protein TVAG_195520 [Trichomonas vaginalis G3]KAI5488090.1 (methyl)glyoxal oxidase [Trichomonas vaginalis G3]|eukprot:XP_001307020.1 hypothetical protein [Trichomonas vaginalis G3]